MNTIIKRLKNKIPQNVIGRYRTIKNILFKNRIINKWENDGYPIPPPYIVKSDTIKKYANDYKIKVFVETGTYLGDMVDAVKKIFDLIYSIELSNDLFLKSSYRFKHYKHINIIEGDSSKELIKISSQIDKPAIYWLDGHYSGGITAKADKICPIYEELEAIFNSKVSGNIILIDDARLFNGQDDYPKIDALINYIKKNRQNAEIEIKYDIIRVIL